MYFGVSSWSASDAALLAIERQFPPRQLSKVQKTGEEWMIADAWYRKRTNASSPELQQEGPYQSDWTGEALPNFAPHGSRIREYAFGSTGDRDSESSRIRSGKQDGKTNTVFFDGHAVPVKSRRLVANGFELLYGFPGTVNPRTIPPGGAYWE